MAYPEWVERQRRPRTNIACARGKYYLYEVTSVYDKEKKRARKVTTGYLGRITEEGLIPPRKKPEICRAPVREYGTAAALTQICGGIRGRLAAALPKEADGLFVLAMLRIADKMPLRLAGAVLERSWLKGAFPEVRMSGAALGRLLTAAGKNEAGRAAFLASSDTDPLPKGRRHKKSAGPSGAAEAVLAALFERDAEGLNEAEREGLCFCNGLTVLMEREIEERLRQAGLSEVSPEELLLRLSGIYRVKIGNGWVLSEISVKTKKMISKLGIVIGEKEDKKA